MLGGWGYDDNGSDHVTLIVINPEKPTIGLVFEAEKGAGF